MSKEILDAIQHPMSNSDYLTFIERLLGYHAIDLDTAQFHENTQKFATLNSKVLTSQYLTQNIVTI